MHGSQKGHESSRKRCIRRKAVMKYVKKAGCESKQEPTAESVTSTWKNLLLFFVVCNGLLSTTRALICQRCTYGLRELMLKNLLSTHTAAFSKQLVIQCQHRHRTAWRKEAVIAFSLARGTTRVQHLDSKNRMKRFV